MATAARLACRSGSATPRRASRAELTELSEARLRAGSSSCCFRCSRTSASSSSCRSADRAPRSTRICPRGCGHEGPGGRGHPVHRREGRGLRLPRAQAPVHQRPDRGRRPPRRRAEARPALHHTPSRWTSTATSAWPTSGPRSIASPHSPPRPTSARRPASRHEQRGAGECKASARRGMVWRIVLWIRDLGRRSEYF